MKKAILTVVFLSLVLLGIFFYRGINTLATSEISSNLEIEIPSRYSSVDSGEQIYFTTRLMNLAQIGRRDVTLTYEIVDSSEKILVSKSETVAVETQASFVNNLIIPEGTLAGDYTLRVTLSENGSTSSTEHSFKVSQIETEEKDYSLIVVVGAIIILVIIALLSRPLLEKIRIRRKIRRIVKAKLK